ncbi:MAG: TonB-dependent receptor plug domain-containing protein [Myxococcota bacterium]
MESRSTSRSALLAVAVLASGHVRAEDEVVLPPVVVPLPAPEASPSSPQKKDPTGAVTLVEVAERRLEAKDAAELIASSPGVVVQDAGGLGQAKSLSLRGAAPNGVLVLLDGIPLNGAGGNVDLSRLPVAIIERFEVLRGGAGARYGSGGLGGAVNVVTRRPQKGARLFGELSAGSFSTQLGAVGASGSVLGGEALFLLHGAKSEGDFPFLFDDKPALEGNVLLPSRRQNNHAAQGGALARFRREGELLLDGLVEAALDARGLAGTAQNPTSDASQRSRRMAASVRAERRLQGGELSALAYGKSDALWLFGGPHGEGYSQLDSSAGLEVSLARLVGERHGLSASAGAALEHLFEPSGTNPAWARLFAMAADEVLFLDGRFALTPSFRVDQSGPYTGLSPKLGAALSLPASLQLSANLGQAHRAPSFLELYVRQGHLLPNEGLRPERALYADLALSRRVEESFVSVGGFYALYEDLIVYEYYPPMLARPFNFAAAEVAGLEAEAEARPHPLLSLAASYTLLFSANLKDDPRYYLKELPYRPRHRLHARIAAGPEVARARAELLYQSAQYQNRAQTLVLPERAFLNLGLASRLWRAPEVSASIEVKNLLDVQSADLDGYPLPPRAVFLTLASSYDAAHD